MGLAKFLLVNALILKRGGCVNTYIHTYCQQLNDRKLLVVLDSAISEGLQHYSQI
jgi:hypothetical protein